MTKVKLTLKLYLYNNIDFIMTKVIEPILKVSA